MRRSALALTLAALLAFIFAMPAGAITFGQLDGNRHPAVGTMFAVLPDGETVFQMCTGTLIDDDVFLTASHCTDIADFVESVLEWDIRYTFEPTVSLSAAYFTGTRYTNPAYNRFKGKGGNSDPGDIAVVVLNKSPRGITPARLPTAGLLTDLQRDGTLRRTRFTAVGYGTVRETMTGGFKSIEPNLDRRFVRQTFNSLTKAWLNLSMVNTPGKPGGGTCYGDSGGPHFLHLNGVETDIVASVTVSGDAPCVALDKTYRTDTAAARAFLANFVDLP
jgi:secreted trypsin-like serine protease